MSDIRTALEKRIGILERKLVRERRAREAAESQLEHYSEQVFNTNLSLQRELAQSKKRQAELVFLGDTSSSATSSQSVSSLLNNTMKLTTDFCAADVGLLLMSAHGQWLSSHRLRSKADTEVQEDSIVSLVKLNLERCIDEALPTWSVIALEKSDLAPWSTLLAANIELQPAHFAWLAFLVKTDEVDEETLFALDTAMEHVRSNIEQQFSQVEATRQSERLENTLESAQKQLVHAEKMASLGQLAAGVAHEINNPVGFVYSNTDIMREYIESIRVAMVALADAFEGKDKLALEDILAEHDVSFLLEDSEEMVNANLDGLRRIRDIVEGLKTFSHVGEDRFTEVQLTNVVSSALQVAGNALKKHKVVNLLGSGDLPNLFANGGQLQQVFVNLFVNAAHAMPEGGTLTIEVLQSLPALTVRVKDTGCGMDDATRAKLFSPFFTTKPVGVGTGLGLSVSYSILEAHHADIKVESSPGQGTAFILTFPLPAQ